MMELSRKIKKDSDFFDWTKQSNFIQSLLDFNLEYFLNLGLTKGYPNNIRWVVW